MPAAVELETLSVAEAVPPTDPAGEKPVRLIPGTTALVIAALVTVPSGSLALTGVDVPVPSVAFSEAGQFGAIGWFSAVTVTATVQVAVCGVGESLFEY